jgi:hypothetical protein
LRRKLGLIPSAEKSQVVASIQGKFAETGNPATVPLLRGGSFRAELHDTGVSVNNLGTSPFIPWAVFKETVDLLEKNGGRARRGDAMGPRLGGERLPLSSVEGHVAHAVYGKNLGESVFRRITPIACLLVWAGVCRSERGELILKRQQEG